MKNKRHVLGVGYPLFGRKSTSQTRFNKVMLLNKANGYGENSISLRINLSKIGAWKKCRLVLEEV